MAVLGRVLFSSAERVDLPDLLSIDSYAAGDWRYFLHTIVGTSKPYILFGFDVINPEAAIGTPTCTVRVADSAVYYPGSPAGPFFYGLPDGDPNSEPLVPQLRPNAVNYVYLTLTTFDTAPDTRALWDPDRNNGEGAEFTQDINTESVIKAQIGVSTGSFPMNTVPVAIVVVGPNGTITSIQDARDLLFRLGSGGINPNPLSEYAFKPLPSLEYARTEPNTVLSSGIDPNPFQGGDKNIKTLKEWMDVVMTRLKELGGTKHWYDETGTFSLTNIFKDVLAGSWKSKGSYTHSPEIPGQLSWSEDIYFKNATSPKDLVIRASGANPINLSNEQVAFIKLIRNEPINPLDVPVAFINGEDYVNAIEVSGPFQNLKKGDWIKKASDDDVNFVQVVEFYGDANATGAVVPPESAISVKLSSPYKGSTSQPNGDRARYDRGEYLPTDIVVVDRSDAIIPALSGNFFWFALRSDTILKASLITSRTVSGDVINADGATATIEATDHGLVTGDRITVVEPEDHAGTYTVESVSDDNTFVIPSVSTTLDSFTGYYALATTEARYTYGYLLESANHGLDSGESVVISETDHYDGIVVANVRSAAQFQFAIPEAKPDDEGMVTVPRIDARSEDGVNKLLQGSTIDVGGSSATDNIRSFIGMSAPDQTSPVYAVPVGYNTINTGVNYNSSSSDSLTARVSKLTAMMADKAQDKTIQFLTNASVAVNEPDVGGVLRNLSFGPSNSTLTITQPGNIGNAVVTLPNDDSELKLNKNWCAYVQINRNAASTPGITVSSITDVPLDENVFIIATRLNDDLIYLWNGQVVESSLSLQATDVAVRPVTFIDPVSLTTPTGNVVIDGVEAVAGDTCLFTNLTLTSANNIIYQAVGIGNNIEEWRQVYAFNGKLKPSLGDAVAIRKGSSFGLQFGKFNGTIWEFNDKVRHFNGLDYFEQSSLISTTLEDNTVEELFKVPWAGNEHMLIDYSIVRSTTRETGTMRIVTDGAVATVSTDSAYLNGNTGITFSAVIEDDLLVLKYESKATGQPGAMKYSVKRWSSSAGGAAGLPTYSGASPLPSTSAADPVDSVQFNSGGVLAGNPNFKIDTVDLSLNFNGLRQGVLSSPITLAADQHSWANLFSLEGNPIFAIIDYSLSNVEEDSAVIGQIFAVRVGDSGMQITNNVLASTGGPAETIDIDAVQLSSGIQFVYTNESNLPVEFKYSWRKWA